VLARDERKEERVLHALLVQSQGLNLQTANDAVPRVLVSLKGKPGKHAVTISYLVGGVRWQPTYDLGYDPRSRSVEATTYALVSQQSGEDWPAAELRFSTGRPTYLIAVPELPTWTLGRQRDFEPRPRPRLEPAPLAWIAPEPVAAARDAAVERLVTVLAAVEQTRSPTDVKRLEQRVDSLKDQIYRSKTRLELLRESAAVTIPKPAPAKPEGQPAPVIPMPAAAPPPAPPPVEAEERAPARVSVLAGARQRIVATGATTAEKPADVLPWTEQGYRPPPVDPDSPAAAAEGYLFTLYAPGRHPVPASGAVQRVPLSRQRFSISPVHRIRPGLSLAAYLTASLSNSTGKPILRGHANLFAGPMFTGRTWLNTALPGRKIVLPLGVDDSVQVVRHLKQKTASQGVVFKDDSTDYTVAIEIANHHRYPVQVELEDQVPVKHETQGAKVEVQGYSSASFGTPDPRGKVLWKGSIAASSVKKLEYSFRIVRPKDWEVQQHDD